MCVTSGTIVEILPPFCVDGHEKIDRYALRVKSPEPPMPFIICRPITWVEFTLPKQVDLDRRVHRYDAEPAHDLGMVRDLLRAHHDARPEEAQVARLNCFCRFGAQRQRAGGGEHAALALEQRDHRVLQYFGVHLERRDLGMLVRAPRARSSRCCPRPTAAAGSLRNAAGAHLADQETPRRCGRCFRAWRSTRRNRRTRPPGWSRRCRRSSRAARHTAASRCGRERRRSESRGASADLRGSKMSCIPSSVGGCERFSSISTLSALVEERGRRADRRGEHDAAAGRHIAGLHDRPVHRPEKAVADHLRQHRQVHVHEAGLLPS